MSVLNLQIRAVFENLENSQTGWAHSSVPVLTRFQPNRLPPPLDRGCHHFAITHRFSPPIKHTCGRVKLPLFLFASTRRSLLRASFSRRALLHCRRLCSQLSTTGHHSPSSSKLGNGTAVFPSTCDSLFELKPPADDLRRQLFLNAGFHCTS
jgi:hypothetical protein